MHVPIILSSHLTLSAEGLAIEGVISHLKQHLRQLECIVKQLENIPCHSQGNITYLSIYLHLYSFASMFSSDELKKEKLRKK